MIHHLLPGRAEHHIPMISRFIAELPTHVETPLHAHVFTVYGATEEQITGYAQAIPACQWRALKRGRRALLNYVLGLAPDDALILHSAFYPWIWPMLLLRRSRPQRTAWIMWGADIYGRRTLRGWFYQRLKALVVPRLGAVSALVPGDFDDLQARVGHCANYVRAIYVPAFDAAPIRSDKEQPSQHGRLRLVLGNSAWEQNAHLEALAWMRRWRGGDFEVICPLGYPRESAYKAKVIAAGREWLGAHFVPIEAMLPLEEYYAVLAGCDAFALNSRTQQGLGNIYYLLLCGKKIYVHGASSTYTMLRDLGFQVYDSRTLETISLAELADFAPELAEHNRMLFQELFSPAASAREWKKLFQQIGALSDAA